MDVEFEGIRKHMFRSNDESRQIRKKLPVEISTTTFSGDTRTPKSTRQQDHIIMCPQITHKILMLYSDSLLERYFTI